MERVWFIFRFMQVLRMDSQLEIGFIDVHSMVAWQLGNSCQGTEVIMSSLLCTEYDAATSILFNQLSLQLLETNLSS
jgi:hypothetical protein